MTEITRRNHLGAGTNILDGCGNGLGQQKAQQDRDQQTERHCLDHDAKEIPRQISRLALIVKEVYDVLGLSVVVLTQRDGVIHIAVDGRIGSAHLTPDCGQDIGCARQFAGQCAVISGQEGAIAIQNRIGTVRVDTQTTDKRRQDFHNTLGRIGFLRCLLE